MLKRLLDIVLAIIGVAFFLPVVPVLVALIKLDSKGAVFYTCERFGKGRIPFKMYKFRTMYETPGQIGPSVCPQGDSRVTPVGRFLRRTKLNELPQLINVLKGDLAVVGPRPESPDLAALYPPHAWAIFTVKPGLFGPNQIHTFHEEEQYPPEVDPQSYYIEVILPNKLTMDLDYVHHHSMFVDLKCIFDAIKLTLFHFFDLKMFTINERFLHRH